MFRTIFVISIIAIGLFFSVQSPFYSLLFYLWFAYFRPEAWVWINFVSQLNLSLIIGFFLVFASLPSIGRFRLTWRVGLVLLFLAQSLVSLVVAEHPEVSKPYWIEFLKVVTIVMVMTFLVSDERRYRLVLLVIALSLGFETSKQGWAQMLLNPGATNANNHPALGDNNGVAVGVLMLIPVFVALAQTSTSRVKQFVYRFFVVGLVYRAVSTYSRGGFVAGGVLAVLMLWRSPRKIRALISTAVLAGVIWQVMPAGYWDRMNTITAAEGERDDSAQGRIHFWRVAIDMAQAKPLTGVGFNGYRESFSTYNTEEGWGEGRAVHSAWFGTLGDMGYPGLILIVATMIGALVSCSRVKKKALDKGQKTIAIYAANLQATLLVYVAGATFLSIQYSEMMWHMIGLSIALERIQAEMPTEAVVNDAQAVRVPPRAVAVHS